MSDLVKEIERAIDGVNLVLDACRNKSSDADTQSEEIVWKVRSYVLITASKTLQRARDALTWYKPEEKQPGELILPEDRVGHGFSDIVLIWHEGTQARSVGYYCPKTGIWYDSIENRQCKPALWAHVLPNPNPPAYTPEEK